jgi:hypothetical protein
MRTNDSVFAPLTYSRGKIKCSTGLHKYQKKNKSQKLAAHQIFGNTAWTGLARTHNKGYFKTSDFNELHKYATYCTRSWRRPKQRDAAWTELYWAAHEGYSSELCLPLHTVTQMLYGVRLSSADVSQQGSFRWYTVQLTWIYKSLNQLFALVSICSKIFYTLKLLRLLKH